MQEVADWFAFEGQADGPASLHRFDIMRDKAAVVSFGWSRIDVGESKDARAKIALRRIILDVFFGD